MRLITRQRFPKTAYFVESRVKALGEVSELHRLRKENKRLRDQLLDEVLSCREERAMLVAAGKEYGFSVDEFRMKYKAGDAKAG